MEHEPSETTNLSSGEWSRRHRASSGVFGDNEPSAIGMAEESESTCSLGEEEGDTEPGNFVLLQRGQQIDPTKVVDAKRSIMERLVSRQHYLIIELSRGVSRRPIGSGFTSEQWELFDELEAIRSATQAIRGLRFD